MDTEQSRALVCEAWQRFGTRDAARIAELFHDDAQWLAPPANATALALRMTHHLQGAQAIGEFIAHGVRRLFRHADVRFLGIHAEGPVVVVEEEMSATLPNGAPYLLGYCFIFTCRAGRIAGVREYMDTQAGIRQVFARGHPLLEPAAGTH